MCFKRKTCLTDTMKRIDAIIPEKNLDAVNKSLHGIGVTGCHSI